MSNLTNNQKTNASFTDDNQLCFSSSSLSSSTTTITTTITTTTTTTTKTTMSSINCIDTAIEDEKNSNIHSGAQWPSISNPDSWFYFDKYFDKYFLRGTGDEHSESVLQEVVQSYENQHSELSESSAAVVNLINSSHSDSLFKIQEYDEEDHKPTTMELNYYSSQYFNNSTIFQHHHHLNQASNSHRHFLHSTLINPLCDYSSQHSYAHHTMFNGLNITSNYNSNNCLTTVTYSNGSNSLIPSAHHHLPSFKSTSEQRYFTSSQEHQQHHLSPVFNESIDLPNCDNLFQQTSFNLNNNQNSLEHQHQIQQHIVQHQSFPIMQPHLPSISTMFDTDNPARQEIDIKEEKLDEFTNIRNSFDLINSSDLLNLNENDQSILGHHQQVQHQSHQSMQLHNSHLSNTQEHSQSTDKNSNQQKLASGLNDGKKLITIEEAANVKLEKVKIERANGMKIYYFKCSLCTYQTNTSQSMKDHLYCIHCKAKNNYKCNICHQTFGWKNNAQRHMRRKHKIEDQTIKRNAIINLI